VPGDPNWWPLPKVYARLLPQLGKFTADDLWKALKSGKLRCARRSEKNPQCKPVPRSFWRNRQFDDTWIGSGDLDICGADAIPGPRRPRDPRTDFDGGEFYVLQPEKFWPALAPQRIEENGRPEEDERGKPGPRPTKEWQWFVAGKYYTEKYNDRQEPTAPELADLCHDWFGYRPATTAINLLLRKLQKILG
jgi:hypothetical protein